MSTVIDYASAVRGLLEAGQTVVEGNVVKVIADNGAEIGNAVVNTATGGNGLASNVYTMTGEVVQGQAVTSGVGFLTLDLGVAGAAIAPCLGVLAGVGLYSLAPEFWTNVSNKLVDAGKTIGGKILAFTDGNNIGFDNDVIEIFKQALVDINFFVADDQNLPPQSFTSINTPVLSSDRILYSIIRQTYYYDDVAITTTTPVKFGVYKSLTENKYYTIVAWTNDGYIYGTRNTTSTDIRTGEVISTTITDVRYSATSSYTYDGKTAYYNVTNIAGSFSPSYFEPHLSASNNANSAVYGMFAWTLLYGEFIEGNGSNLQDPDDTTFPDNDPFPLKYPDWLPWEYPSTAPQGLPDIYPVKAPEVQPTPYPTQDPAQNPNPENDPDFYPWLEPWFDIPNPVVPDPQPQPEPDPDPQPQPEPDPDPQPDPQPDPDPVDPNPDPPIPPIPPVPPSPDTVNSNRLFTVYNPTEGQLNSLGAYLWDGSLMETIKKIWQNPLDGIISLIQVYATPSTGSAHNIILGYLDSGVSANVVTSQFTTIDCGSVQIKEEKKNVSDYSPYASLHLYLPFIGMVELDVNECMNGTINVIYKVDVYTGTCLAEVKVTRSKDMPNATILYEFSGNASQQIPLTSGNATGMLSTLVSGVGAGLSIATGGGLGVVAGATMLGHSLTHEMYHVSHSGNLSANAGIMGIRTPFVVIGRRHGYDANNYSRMYGYPANKTVYLGNQQGFTRVKSCRLQTSATDPEREQILSLLQSGVII